MKNKILINSIFLAVFIVTLFGYNKALASNPTPVFYDSFHSYSPEYLYTSPVAPAIPQPVTVYVQQPINYVPQPYTYSYGEQQTYKYKEPVKKVETKQIQNPQQYPYNPNQNSYVYPNNGMMMNNQMGASAYGYGQPYNNGQQMNSNDLTALSVKGSGGFFPSSVFQWFLVILLILAIVIIARMISRSMTKSHNSIH